MEVDLRLAIFLICGLTIIDLSIGTCNAQRDCDVESLQCDDTTLEEERAHSISCEILMDALYDLEMSGSAFESGLSPNDQTSALQKQKHREYRILKRRKRNGMAPKNATTTEATVDRPNNPPFFPSANMTQYENQIRLQVCKSLLQFPGVRQRCCTTLWVTCPEYGPNSTHIEAPAPAPRPSIPIVDGEGNIFESSSSNISPLKNILSGVANNLAGTLTSFLNQETQREPFRAWFGNSRGEE